MSEMIERVARAIKYFPDFISTRRKPGERLFIFQVIEWQPDGQKKIIFEGHQGECEALEEMLRSHAQARAVIEAMREPTDKMSDAGYAVVDDGFGTPNPDRAWTSMIDAALTEPQPAAQYTSAHSQSDPESDHRNERE